MDAIKSRINDRRKSLGWSFADVATFIGVSDRTLRKKCNEPDTFTVLELRRMAELLTDTQMADVMREVGL